MVTVTKHFESESQQHEKRILIEKFRSSTSSLIGSRLPRALQAEAESIGFSDLLELVIELDCLDDARCDVKDVIRLIEERVEDSSA